MQRAFSQSESPPVAPLRAQPTVEQPSVVRVASTRQSRSKTRDSIMQVSSDTSDPFKDPIADTKRGNGDAAARENQAERAESATQDEPAPLRPSADPFPEEAIPAPPATEMPVPATNEFAPRESAPRSLAQEEGLLEGITMPGDLSCEAQKAECNKIIEQLRRRDIREIVVGIVVEGEEGVVAVEGKDYPCECKMPNDRFTGRHWSPTRFTWKATGVCHKPLYFEDVQLERYGHSWNPVVQPFMSAAHFFVSVPLLPYKMGLTPPGECIYTLGYYRPGNCAPYLIDPIPLSLRAVLFEAAAGTGFVYLFVPPAG